MSDLSLFLENHDLKGLEIRHKGVKMFNWNEYFVNILKNMKAIVKFIKT